MPTWNSEQYLQFAHERTQPAIDLAGRIALERPSRVVDLGCGPGNSTEALAARFPGAQVAGVDSSESMLMAARRAHPDWTWTQADIADWAHAHAGTAPGDVVFSNAALQWVPDHRRLLPALLQTVAAGGALAFQIPHTTELSHQVRMRVLAESPTWKPRFTRPPAIWHVEPAGLYYDLLAPAARRVDLWLTDYAHVLPGPEAVVEWYRGTGLRPYLEALPDDAARAEFLADYLTAITPDHPRQADGRVLMYFRRLFVVAYR